MHNNPGQLAAEITLALLLLVVASLLVTRMLRALPGGDWVTLPVPGRGLLCRTMALLVLLVLMGLLLDALTVEDGRQRRLQRARALGRTQMVGAVLPLW